ncbi:MAG: response regulator [Flavobacteriia bacterium]
MKVVIADDHPIFRSGLKFLLETSFQGIEIKEFDNGSAVLEECLVNPPDVVVLDIDMPEKNGLLVCDELIQQKCPSKIIILTMYKDAEMLKLAFYNGAHGYLVKDNTSEEMVDCIQTILDGRSYIAKSIRESQPQVDSDDLTKTQIAELLQTLTRTELKTLKLVSQKLPSKEIADLLFVSVKSVENYRSRICKKLNLDARNNSLLLWVVDNKSIIEKIQ